jgi:hypothetical protein
VAKADPKAVAAQQADDDALWFQAATAPEDYVQHALRHLTAAVEGETCPVCGCDEWEPV